jgi:hypothetical protein
MPQFFNPSLPIGTLNSIDDLNRILSRAPNIYTTSSTGSTDDIGSVVLMNSASANSYTINRASSLVRPFPLYCFLIVSQIGAGATSIVAGTGVTINGVSIGTVAMTSAGETTTLWQYAADSWIAFNKTAA